MTMTETTTNRAGVLKLWVLNFFANAVLLAAAYFWLTIPDAHGWQVAGTLLLAAGVVFAVLWLRAGTLAWFRTAEFRGQHGIWAAYRRSLRNVPALAFWILIFLLVGWWLLGLREYVPQTAVWLRQMLGGGPAPGSFTHVLAWLLHLVLGLLWPGLWLPIATTVAAVGVKPHHLARSRRVWKRPLYWLWFCSLFTIGVYVPYKFVWWIPDLQTLRQQAWSMGSRFLLAYLVALSAFLAVVWVAGIYTEREDPLQGE